MASRRKLPLVLFLITLVLLAGAVVLLLRGRPVTLERIAARQGYAITGQEEATVTLTLSREQMPEGFPEEVPISQAEGELKLPLLQDGDTTFYLTAFARSDEDPRHPLRRHSAGASALPGRGTASPPLPD